MKLANPFAPFSLQELHHYYELVRNCVLHWYFQPHWFISLFLFPLSDSVSMPQTFISTQYSPVPYKSPNNVHATSISVAA